MQTRSKYDEMCQLLGVDPKEGLRDIKKIKDRYRILSLEHHPDKVVERLKQTEISEQALQEALVQAEAEFKKINNAYQYALNHVMNYHVKRVVETPEGYADTDYTEEKLAELNEFIQGLSSEALCEIVINANLKKPAENALSQKLPLGVSLEAKAEEVFFKRAFSSKQTEEQQVAFNYYQRFARQTNNYVHLMNVAGYFREKDPKNATEWYRLILTTQDSYPAFEEYCQGETDPQAIIAFLEEVLKKYPNEKDRKITKTLYQFYKEFHAATVNIASPERRQFLFLWKYAEFIFYKVEITYSSRNVQHSTSIYEEAILHPQVKLAEARIIIDHLLSKGSNQTSKTKQLEMLAKIFFNSKHIFDHSAKRSSSEAQSYARKKYLEIFSLLTETERSTKIVTPILGAQSKTLTYECLAVFMSRPEVLVPDVSQLQEGPLDIELRFDSSLSLEESRFLDEIAKRVKDYKDHLDVAKKLKKEDPDLAKKEATIWSLINILNDESSTPEVKYTQLKKYVHDNEANLTHLAVRRGDSKFWKIIDAIKTFFGYQKSSLGIEGVKVTSSIHSHFNLPKKPSVTTPKEPPKSPKKE